MNSEQTIEQSQKKLAVGVQFRTAAKIYTFVTEDSSLSQGDQVIVESEDGTSLAIIAVAPYEADLSSLPTNIKKLLRRASEEDLSEAADLKEKAIECFQTSSEKIRSRALPMKLGDVDIAEDGKKVIFTFFAESRVDFRALVKDLASLLRMRIEMRQIGSRDEAKIAGCMGPCGQTTCCSTHLRQFQSISISMAKHQGLAPNPAKLTGMCNKLKCCLAYEQAVYDECRKGLPKAGSAVESPKGSGKIVGHNVLKRECTVRLYGGGEARVPCDDCRKLTPEEREKAVAAAKKAKEEGEEKSRRRIKGKRERRNAKAGK